MVTVEVAGAGLVRAGGRRGGLAGAEVRRRETPSPIVLDDFIDLAFQRGIGAMRPAGGVCRSVGRTCDGHARSSLAFGLRLQSEID